MYDVYKGHMLTLCVNYLNEFIKLTGNKWMLVRIVLNILIWAIAYSPYKLGLCCNGIISLRDSDKQRFTLTIVLLVTIVTIIL